MTTVQTCAACGNTSFSPFLICTDYTVSRETFPIMKCNSCSLLITSPRPENDALSKYYQSENYISHTGKANNLIHFLYLQIRKITLANKRELLESLTEDKSLLDFGCGTGSLINYLHQYKWKVAGYEPNLVTSTDSNENVPIYKNQEEISGSYSLISLWHVLEHTPNPAQTLVEIKPHLNTNGKLIIAVPNHTSYDATYYQQFWAAYDVPRHLYHFNKSCMERLLHTCGYTIEKILPMPFDAYYVSLLSEQYKGVGLSKFFKALYRSFISNAKARKTGEYSSLIYIARP
jgi:SAM-dependent methyltransferase